MQEIRFYKVNDIYGFFSNLSPHPVFLEKAVWPTVEHYFQANKFESIDLRNIIKSLDSPLKAASEGRDVKHRIRQDWESVKEKIMLEALYAKFMQHPELKVELLKTIGAVIVEDAKGDSHWGIGSDGKGHNRLGSLIMQVRDKIIQISADISLVLPPWIAFPNIDQHDLFWGMGLGEDYLTKWAKYYLNLQNKMQYKDEFPPGGGWEGIYN